MLKFKVYKKHLNNYLIISVGKGSYFDEDFELEECMDLFFMMNRNRIGYTNDFYINSMEDS